ncbi:hypothetical protein FE784_00365 [Paenibacillus hemerocallicola]|uniref:Uncharacterized protein n=1 Tax=Paenibacillus hemerocallicola TaxID=1172614 RepID=A0A5C4TG95_9BACL|nr:hypothetical protein [Paenibacillus hemerocallicola]TNJ68154.1 hypothetical protein FE784_00365 [Paenibacillus hemerocallicola]
MNWLNPYEADLIDVFTEAENRVGAFPAPFNEIGIEYLHRFHPFREGSSKNYICYLLPFWLKHIALERDEACKRMALSNIFVMLHFFIQDDLMDEPPAKWKTQLALDHLIQLQYMELYRPLFPAESSFWTYFGQYVTEWATSVSDENERDAFFIQPTQIAHKASPVKLASTGLLLLSGREELVPEMSGLIDQVLITLQMADDRADWREDLQSGSANSLLSFIRQERRMNSASGLTVQEVESSIHVRGCLRRYAQIAEQRHERLRTSGTQAMQLIAFHDYLTQSLLSEAVRIERDKNRLLQGGFSYWLSKNGK